MKSLLAFDPICLCCFYDGNGHWLGIPIWGYEVPEWYVIKRKLCVTTKLSLYVVCAYASSDFDQIDTDIGWGTSGERYWFGTKYLAV